ncbi:AbiJ-NTD4 domain-containing protein [Mesorhizobium yinganensis]|uniref:AbiJ-NTD4 domain-containing protein n=1 Tax=Mesorhizobium yinganensis TaxID=3157707 RepID=UPI0032B74AB9
MNKDRPYIPFSQRTGLEPIPPQLKLGEVSAELRRLLDYYIGLEIDRETGHGYGAYFLENGKRVTMDLHVRFFGQSASSYNSDPSAWRKAITETAFKAPIGRLFDFVEFFVRNPRCSETLKRELAGAFVSARAAYRIVDNEIVAIGTAEQAAAFERAIADAETNYAGAARAHLVAAGVALRNSDWAGSIRESIHAVESIAVALAPGTDKLGPALAALEKQGHLHGGLKAAFGALYGYSSDEKGIRHALVYKDEAQVDETDALFMLGACASFVSYLLARAN